MSRVDARVFNLGQTDIRKVELLYCAEAGSFLCVFSSIWVLQPVKIISLNFEPSQS